MNRTDGYQIGDFSFQGVRVHDDTSSQWLTPHAYAGNVGDPMTQKPFMWNGNNPVQYSDPSGFEACGEPGLSGNPYNWKPRAIKGAKVYVKLEGGAGPVGMGVTWVVGGRVWLNYNLPVGSVESARRRRLSVVTTAANFSPSRP